MSKITLKLSDPDDEDNTIEVDRCAMHVRLTIEQSDPQEGPGAFCRTRIFLSREGAKMVADELLRFANGT